MTSPFSRISMEGFYSVKSNTNTEQIDLSLKLSPCGQNVDEEKMVLTRASSSMVWEKANNSTKMGNGAEEGPFVLCLAEGEKGFVRFGDLQTMRRVRTGKRLLMKKMLMAAAAEAEKSLPVFHPLPHSIDNNLKAFPDPSVDSWHKGRASSNFQTLHRQENDLMVSPKAMEEMTLWPSEITECERQAKRLKHVNSYHKSDAMDIMRQMPSVATTGDSRTGKRIEGLLYKYKRDQVCIVCVCHGSFLSPTEFVMHAGGKEVADPMKHITVSSNSFYSNGDGAGFITHPFLNV
ncbi:hypothetical protein VNO78_23690 [Psophocarpus tetragonolobus]|uniref:Ninja-family protein n=1 Tax=Psophocarpus tetragonolobus TaxID=3891 RepID=A0AAN9S768_PSOTE